MGRYGTPGTGRADRLTATQPALVADSTEAPVVVGVDGSRLSLSAVRLAAREAALHGRPLRVVHMFNWTADPRFPLPPEELRDESERLTEEAVACAVEAEPDLPVSSAILEGPPVTTLLRESAAAGLLAIGDGGLGRLGRVDPDATALQIAARAGCSVLVAREAIPPPGPIVVGIDGSESSEAALDFDLDAAARRRTTLVAVRAWDPVVAPEGTEAGIAELLAEAVERGRQRRPQIDIEVEARVRVGDPKIALVEQSTGAQLVVASARGDEPWRGMLGAVSQALIYHSDVPVVIVRGAHELYVQV